MPRYDFGCEACGEAFEKQLRMTQSGEPQACPACGSMQTRKRIGVVAVSNAGRAARSVPPPSSPFT
ncbi:MAG: zinc ribbon domain-containing protein [Anaerolineae bacterium]|nr:zinc ribbon domain-containing protein [Anaerolineae bacterium]